MRRDAAGDGAQWLDTSSATGHHRGRLALTANVTLFSPAAAEAMTLAGINAPALSHSTEHAHAL